jgi:peptidoglycan/LPS O-acetylase OafA/YrhL
MRINNFDLIRLGAASQVMLDHGLVYLNVTSLAVAARFFNYFPGVPIFFVISGFLISMSWDRAPSFRQYAWNRILRIYPALWVCLAVSVALFLACGVRPDSAAHFITWIAAQITVFQYDDPGFLRGFGVGVLNGSLWTISIELEFYLLLPLLALVAMNRPWRWVALTMTAIVVMNVTRASFLSGATLLQKLIAVSIIPYLFYFLVGVNARLLYERRPGIFRGKALYWAAVYGLWAVIETTRELENKQGNQLNVLSIVLLAMLTVSTAFTVPTLTSRLLRENDISYGVYIYHMPLVNLLLWSGILGGRGFALLAGGTIALAWLSWRLVERPALGLKHYSLRRTG